MPLDFTRPAYDFSSKNAILLLAVLASTLVVFYWLTHL